MTLTAPAKHGNVQELLERLGTIPPEQLASGQISTGYLNIAAGNVGEVYAEPIRQAMLKQLQQKYPGAFMFAVMPSPANSRDNARVRFSSPALLMEYGSIPTLPTFPCTDPTLRIRPHFCFLKTGTASWENRIGARMLARHWISISVGLTSSHGVED